MTTNQLYLLSKEVLHIGYYHYRVGTKTIWLAPRDPIQLSMGPQKLNNWISYGLKLWKCCVFELWSFFGVFKLIWQIPRNQKVKNEKFAPIFFDKKWVNFNRLWVNMVSIRMIVKSGQKNELQNLGFRTYYNHCAVTAIIWDFTVRSKYTWYFVKFTRK